MNTERLIVSNHIPDRKIPGQPLNQVEIKEIFDPYKLMTYLDHAGYPKEQMEELIDLSFKGCLNSTKFNIADFDREDPTELSMITFWYDDKSELPSRIHRYLEFFRDRLIIEAEHCEGEEDYSDYYPSIFDVFYQVAKYYKEEKIWKELLGKVEKIFHDADPDSDFLNDVTYRIKF